MKIDWNEDDRILTIDGVPYECDDDPVDIPVATLRAVPGAAIPPGIKIRAVRKVLGSSRDVYGDPENVYFERTPGGALLVVEDALFVDSDDEPAPAHRAELLSHEIAEARIILRIAQELGIVLRYEFSEVYDDEIVYLRIEVPTYDLDRSAYSILQSAPDSYHDLLRPGTTAAVLAALHALGSHQGNERGLLDHVRALVKATGHRPGDLRMEYGLAQGQLADAILLPYETFNPLAIFEVRRQATDDAVEQAEQYRRAAGATAMIVMAPNLLLAKKPGVEVRVAPARASMKDAEEVLQFLKPAALAPTPRKPTVEAPELLVALSQAIEAAEAAQTNDEKGRTYEDLACLALQLVAGVRVKYRNRRTDTAELDIIAEYSGEPRNLMLEEHGRYILAECKNWASPAGAKHLRDFCGKMKDCQVSLGLFFSRNGITGASDRDAAGVIKKNFHQESFLVIVLDLEDLRAVAAGEDMTGLLDRRYDSLRFQFA